MEQAKNTLNIPIYSIDGGDVPVYEYEEASGADLKSSIDFVLRPFSREAIPTGVHIAVPVGYEAQLRAKSGNALVRGYTLANGVGTIDSDFRGEIQAILLNTTSKPIKISRGDKICQLVVVPVLKAHFIPVGSTEELGKTARGDKGFGSTGK